MTLLQWLFLIIIGGLIGWSTNKLAIWLLFKPHEAIRIPIFGCVFQGVIPRRKRELAHSIGVQIEAELVSMGEILQAFGTPEQKKELTLFLRLYLNEMLLEKIPAILRDVMKKPVEHFVADLMHRESDRLLTEILEYLMEEGAATVQLAIMVEEKINAFPSERLESMVLAVASQELKHIEWIGGFLGMAIGFFQGAFLYFGG